MVGILSYWDTNIVKKFFLIMVIMVLAVQLPALAALTISSLGNGFYRIVAPGSTAPGLVPLSCVLQSSPDLITWTSVSTNTFPTTGAGYGVTNIVQAMTAGMFYRVISPGPTPASPKPKPPPVKARVAVLTVLAVSRSQINRVNCIRRLIQLRP